MVLYKILKIENEDYDAECIHKNDLLYEGGTKLSKYAELFLPRDPDESDEFYAERCSTAYDPIFNNTLERIKSLLFATPLSVVASAVTNDPATKSAPINSKLEDFLHAFEKNCDGHNTSLHNFAKQALLTSLKQNHCITMVDFPRVSQEQKVNNLQDQLDKGQLNGYLVDIPLSTVIDWERDENGKLTALKLFIEKKHRDSFLSPLMCLYRWTTIGLENGLITFHIYEKDLNLDEDQKLDDNDDIPEIPSSPIVTSFTELNVAEMCLEPGLALGNMIAPACEQLFRTDSIINAATQRNVIFSLPILKAGNNMPAAGGDGRRAINTVQMSPYRFGEGPNVAQKSGGWMLIGKDDDAIMLESEGKGMAALQEQKKILIERINASVHQVAQNIQARGTAQAASAAAKQEDRRDTEIILGELKLVVECYILKIVKFLLSMRKKSDVSLHMEGLNVEDDIDRDQVLKEIVAYGQFPEAEIFKVNFEYNNAIGLLGDDLDDDDKVELRKQIEETIKARPSPQELLQQEQNANNKTSSSSSDSKSDDSDSSDASQITGQSATLGPAGHPLQPDGAHLSNGDYVDAQTIYDQLADDYKAKDIKFVLQMSWLDKTEVPLASIDFSNKDNWEATSEPEKIDEFAEKIQDGFDKPIILVNNKANNNKMMIVDGHHRALAHLKLGQPVPAYVGEISKDRGPWDKLHSKQVGSKQEQSIQKETSNQVEKSEK